MTRNKITRLNRFQRFMCRQFVNRPEVVFGLGTLILWTLLMVVSPHMEMTEQTNYDWTVSSSEESKFQDITASLIASNDPAVGSKSSSVDERADTFTMSILQIMYENSQASGKQNTPIYTPENLKAICEVESVLWDMPEYHTSYCQVAKNSAMQMPETTGNCSTPLMSIVPRFYLWPPFGKNPSRKCTLLSQTQIETVEKGLLAQLQTPGAPTAYFLGSNVDVKNPSSPWRTRSMLVLGAPLQGYTNDEDRKLEQLKKYKEFGEKWEQKMFDLFKMKNKFGRSAYRDKAIRGNIEARFFSQLFNQFEFKRVVDGDLLWTIASVAFVFFYMRVHTESFFLASVGMMQILFSLPITYAVYRYLFLIPFYTQLHILTIFLVLGVGADDVFVLVDAWKQALSQPQLKESHVFQKVLFAYERAFGAIFNTSFTTAMAFVSTAFSPVMPISAFGYYAAIAIVVNYLYVVFYTPSAVILYYKYFQHRGFCGCMAKKGQKSSKEEFTRVSYDESMESPQKLSSSKEINYMPEPEPVSKSLADRFFSGPYVDFITSKTTATITVVVLAIVMVQGVIFALHLTPPVKAEEWFSKDHMSTGIMDRLSEDFLSGPDTAYIHSSFVWGSTGLDRSKFNKWFPGENRGKPIMKTDFDISTKEAHTALLNTCKALREAKCDVKGCMDSSGMLIRQGSVECWIEEMQKQHGGTLPTGEAFITELINFRKANPKYVNAIGLIQGKLSFIRIQFVLTLEKQQPYGTTFPVNQEITKVLDRMNAVAPASLGSAFVEAGRWFTWVRTEEGLVSGMYNGLAICFPIAFLVLLVATGNYLLSIYATTSIAAIVACVLGFCQSVMGWHLGTAESISAVIVIGFSVDYIVHLGHMYEESRATTSAERTAEAARRMAPTVAAGAVTTLGSGSMMFMCQMVFFSKMATLISLTITLSLVFSLGFFMAFCALFGPVGSTGNIHAACSKTSPTEKDVPTFSEFPKDQKLSAPSDIDSTSTFQP